MKTVRANGGQGVKRGSENGKAGMGLSLAVQIQPVAVEAPRQFRIGGEGLRTHQIGKGASVIGRIGRPETLIATKSWQPGVNAHSCACANQEGVSIRENRYFGMIREFNFTNMPAILNRFFSK